MTDHPDVWTDGSLILDQVTGVSSSGSGFFAHQDPRFWRGCRWGHVDDVHTDLDRVFFVGVSLQFLDHFRLFRGLRCGVFFLALQTSRAVHLGVDNLGVVRHVDRLLRGSRGPKPFELVNDGDLLLLLQRMLNHRGLDTVRITKVKGHADDAMVLHGRVRREDRLGNDAADEAVLLTLLCHLGKAELSGTCWAGHSWRNQIGLGYGCSVVPLEERVFFLPFFAAGRWE